jgi:hypothetical protein
VIEVVVSVSGLTGSAVILRMGNYIFSGRRMLARARSSWRAPERRRTRLARRSGRFGVLVDISAVIFSREVYFQRPSEVMMGCPGGEGSFKWDGDGFGGAEEGFSKFGRVRWSMDFAVPPTGSVDGLIINMRGGGNPIPTPAKLCNQYGWEASDAGKR